jgi:hypothetical protein
MTPFSSISTIAGDVSCVITLDDVAQATAPSLLPNTPVS